MKNRTIFFKKWPSTGCLDGHLAKGLQRILINKSMSKIFPICSTKANIKGFFLFIVNLRYKCQMNYTYKANKTSFHFKCSNRSHLDFDH